MTTPISDLKPGDNVLLTGADWETKGLLGTVAHVVATDHPNWPGLPYVHNDKGRIFFIHSQEDLGCGCDYSATKVEAPA